MPLRADWGNYEINWLEIFGFLLVMGALVAFGFAIGVGSMGACIK